MGEIGDGIAIHLQVDGDGRAAELRMGGGAGVGRVEAADAGDVAGEFEDTGVVDVIRACGLLQLTD